MTHQYSFKIASPCSENFNNMLSVSEGKYCEVCAKTVIDFSQMTENEIATFIHLNKGKEICGTIQSQQQNKKYLFVQPQKAESPVKRYVMAILTGLLTTIPSQIYAQNNIVNKTEAVSLSHIQNNLTKDTIIQNSISGRILDKKTNKPLIKIIVSFDLQDFLYVYRHKAQDKIQDIDLLIDANGNYFVYNKSQIDSLIIERDSIKKRMEEVRNIRLGWGKTIFSTTTDMEGYFTLVLPSNLPVEIENYKNLFISLNFQDSSPKNTEGKEDEWIKNRIKNFHLNLKLGGNYIEQKVEVIEKEYPGLSGKVQIIEEDDY